MPTGENGGGGENKFKESRSSFFFFPNFFRFFPAVKIFNFVNVIRVDIKVPQKDAEDQEAAVVGGGAASEME